MDNNEPTNPEFAARQLKKLAQISEKLRRKNQKLRSISDCLRKKSIEIRIQQNTSQKP